MGGRSTDRTRPPDRPRRGLPAARPPGRTRRAFLAASAAGVAGLAGCVTGPGGSGETVTVFHAGSLSAPFEAAEAAFEDRYGLRVNREAQGSVGSMNKITEQGRRADVLGVSDFRLLRDAFLPAYGDWYGLFATNAMAIAYTPDSMGADAVGPDTWWEVLGRDDVAFGHSDPAIDPNGYRSVMAMRLGAVPFRGERLYREATARALVEKAKIPSGTETDLLSQLQAGALDYAWGYQSAGASHDVRVVDLGPHVDLSKATDAYARHYARASVEAGGATYTGAPIAYGITVPGVAANPEAGAKWIAFVTGPEGRKILAANGFTPVEPMVVPASHRNAVPERAMANARTAERLGPLEL